MLTLSECGDDIIILPVFSELRNVTDYTPKKEACNVTSLFEEFCYATVRCEVNLPVYRSAARDTCGSDFDNGYLTFVYSKTCLAGALWYETL